MPRSCEEINELREAVEEHTETRGSNVPSMSYEDGVLAAVLWMLGLTDEHPMQKFEGDDEEG